MRGKKVLRGGRKWLAIMGILLGPIAMGISFSLINTTLESIHQDFGASLLQLQWIINLYGIFIASSLVIMGRLGDVFGRKKIFLLGYLFFLIAMIGGGLATSPGMIIAFMPFYGLAGGVLLPISQAMMIDLYEEEDKSKAIGVWAAFAGIAMAAGPIVGGLVMTYLHWRWIFLINAPFALLGIVMVLAFCLESKNDEEASSIDWTGGILLFLTVGTFVLATVQSKEWSGALIVALYALSLIGLIFLLIVEKKVTAPIIREDLFKNRQFLFTSVAGFCMIGFFWGAIFLIPLFIQKVLLYSPMEAGICLLFLTFPIAIFSPFSSFFYKRLGPKALMFTGFFSLAISTLLFLHVDSETTFNLVALSILVMGIGFAFIWAPVTTSALSIVSKKVAGVASGSFVTIQEIGGNVCLAITGAVVRFSLPLSVGFYQGVWILFMICIIGLVSILMMPRRKKNVAP